MITKQITFTILLLSTLTHHSSKAMEQSKSNVNISRPALPSETVPTYQRIYLVYPAFNNYANNPDRFEKKFKSTLVLHLCELEHRGKTPEMLEKFEKRQLLSMEKQKQKIIKNMTPQTQEPAARKNPIPLT